MYRIKSRHKRYQDFWADWLWQKKMVLKFASQRKIHLKDFTWSTNDGPNDLFTKFIQDLQLFFLRRALGVAIYQRKTRENRYEFKRTFTQFRAVINSLLVTYRRDRFLRWRYTRRFATTIFSTTQRCNVVTIRNNVATMLKRCVVLKIVVANRLV